MRMDEILDTARQGAALGCNEALFTLGELLIQALACSAALGCGRQLTSQHRHEPATACVLHLSGH